MKEQAERENRNLNDLVVERYGVRIIASLHLSHAHGHIRHMHKNVIRIRSDIQFMHAEFNTL